VERARTARRYISQTKPPYSISDLEIIELDKETYAPNSEIRELFKAKKSFGLISESGALAHKNNYKVVPLVGPSSIILALAASGLNGQNFTFHGYLPIKGHELTGKLKKLEVMATKSRASQIFIETPYRNQRLFDTLIKHVAKDRHLCVAMDITGENESIVTKTIAEWIKHPAELKKEPTIFILA